jgi:DNA-binding MarR family transcriptional regulator
MELTFGFLTSDIARLLRKVFDQRARRVGLSLAQARVMIYLERLEGTNQARLADALEVRPISLARLLDRMQTSGWIERRPDPGDRRAHRLYLSAKARPVLSQIRSLAAQTRAEALAGLSVDEQQRLMGMMTRVHGNLIGHPLLAPSHDGRANVMPDADDGQG